jgi:hypothetical protein
MAGKYPVAMPWGLNFFQQTRQVNPVVSAVPNGTDFSFGVVPGVETPGFFRLSLRDFKSLAELCSAGQPRAAVPT